MVNPLTYAIDALPENLWNSECDRFQEYSKWLQCILQSLITNIRQVSASIWENETEHEEWSEACPCWTTSCGLWWWCGHIRWWRAGSAISSSVSLPSPSFQDLPIPYIPPPHGALCTPSPWYRIRAKEVGMLEKQLPNENRNLQRNVAENWVKEEYFRGSIGLKTISGTKQEREKVLSEYQSCLRKFSWRRFAGSIWDKCSQIVCDTEVEARLEEDVKKLVSEWFHKWIKVFEKKASERISTRKMWDYAIELKDIRGDSHLMVLSAIVA